MPTTPKSQTPQDQPPDEQADEQADGQADQPADEPGADTPTGPPHPLSPDEFERLRRTLRRKYH
jgi:hypothetical protein